MRANNNITFDCKYHIVWCPKYRRPLLKDGVDARLKEIIENVASELRVIVLEKEVMPDHVHLLVDCDPQLGIHRFVKRVKGLSSRVLREEFRDCRTKVPTLWTNSYFVSTVGGAPLDVVKRYIEEQKTR